MGVAKSHLYFLPAGLCETGGGYLIWLWVREDRGAWPAAAGAAALVLYGAIPPCSRPASGGFTRREGGVFIVLSLSWGWWVDGARPDRFDVVGGAIALAGVLIIMYWPRP